MKTPQKQAPKWRPGAGRPGLWAESRTWPPRARRGASSCPQGSAARCQACPGLRGWNPALGWHSWPQGETVTALAHSVTIHPSQRPLTHVCVDTL